MGFLYEEMTALRKHKKIAKCPEYIPKNLNPKFELRDYQIKAFENFVEHFEDETSPRPLQVLFHMATGSGKTLIMAGLMLYLYKQGYRNFLFFVNLTNIIDKTRENFLNADSTKYLFAEEIVIDGEKVPINVVENFQSVDDDAINICFETTQGLHSDVFFVKENAISAEDVKDKKIVFISDEAHHLNVATKNSANKDSTNSWEQTVQYLFKLNAENILLEFTATCDINNKDIRSAYEDKIIFNYPLQNFYDDKYSKEILSMKSNFQPIEKALQAIILSQYRLKIFQDNRLNVKPIVLFKSLKIKDSEKFLAEFLEMINSLDGNYLEKFLSTCNLPIMDSVKKYFQRNGITYEMLAAELRDDFSEQHCISVNDDKDAQKNQILLNSLENLDNPYRAIFEVKKLDEGWDVLNLFDIVKLYETKTNGKKISATTISEAQLIGRGARYCPFQIDDEQPKFQRKYDSDVDCELRICETLYYHCQNDSQYIKDLKEALKELGLNLDKKITCEYKLKENFKASEFYKTGKIFLNTRHEVKSTTNFDAICKRTYSVKLNGTSTGTERLMVKDAGVEIKSVADKFFWYTIKEIAAKNYSIVHKALRKFPILKFSNLKNIFPNLDSTKTFITGEKFLGGVKIEIASAKDELSFSDLYRAVCEVLPKIAAEISTPKKEYIGTKDFHPVDISKIFTDKKVYYSDVTKDGKGESQKLDTKFPLDLSTEDWFAYADNFGTSEEKAFVKYFSKHYAELCKHYDKIFLVRNERQFPIYSFDEGGRFEPDYVLFLRKNSETWQIFIEPKGDHLISNDEWKEKFLLELKGNAVAKKFYVDDPAYKIWGFHFYNRDKENNFDEDFQTLLSK